MIAPTGDAVNEPVKTEGAIMKEEMTKMIMQCMEAVEEIAKEVATVKEEMASYREKMEKMSATPAATKISTFNANPSEEKENALDARVDHLAALKASFKTNKRF
jgi:K+/H+ antiporter YhaU regulatory subunit KhtT